MVKLFLVLLMVKNSVFVGVVENPHYIASLTSQEGYYLENETSIEAGKKVTIVNDKIVEIGEVK